jgi:hypothetical protein
MESCATACTSGETRRQSHGSNPPDRSAPTCHYGPEGSKVLTMMRNFFELLSPLVPSLPPSPVRGWCRWGVGGFVDAK